MEILFEKSISQVYGIRFLLHHHVGIKLVCPRSLLVV